MKYILLSLFLAILFTSCAYDPDEGVLRIENKSDSLIYVAYGCHEELEEIPQIGPIDSTAGYNSAHYAHPHDSRIRPKDYGLIPGFATPEHKLLTCDETEKLSIFFLSDYTLRHYDWTTIRKNRMYIKKLAFNQHQLDSLKWIVTYK